MDQDVKTSFVRTRSDRPLQAVVADLSLWSPQTTASRRGLFFGSGCSQETIERGVEAVHKCETSVAARSSYRLLQP